MPLIPAARQIERLVEGLADAGFVVTNEYAPSTRPVVLWLVGEGRELAIRVFCWNITPGGAHRAANERRVQVTLPAGQSVHAPGEPPTLLLGYSGDLDVFAAWDASKHEDPGHSPSLQVPLEILEEAASEGFAGFEREVAEGREVVLAFRPELVGSYLEVASLVESLPDEDAPAMAAAASGADLEDTALPDEPVRRRALLTVSVAIRDARFRKRVREAYGGRCAFCGLNAGLVEAAHVKPVHGGGGDEVTNGVCACPTHHKAFDRGFLTVQADMSITVNEQRVRDAGGTDADLDAIRASLFAALEVPAQAALQPAAPNVEAHRELWA